MQDGRKKVYFFCHVLTAIIFAYVSAEFFGALLYIFLKSFDNSVVMDTTRSFSFKGYFYFFKNTAFLGAVSVLMAWLKPVHDFLNNGRDDMRDTAADRFNDIYKSIMIFYLFLFAANNILHFTFFGNRLFGLQSLFMNYSVIPSFSVKTFILLYFLPLLFYTYYSIYFTILYLEPFLVLKNAHRFYDEETLYKPKKRFVFGIRARLFFAMINLNMIPMCFIAFMSLSPSIDPELARKYSLAAIAVSMIYSMGYIDLVYKSIQRPIISLIDKMEKLAAGDFTVKSRVLSDDEIGKLKYNFNQMVDGLAERERLKETFGKYVSIEIAKHLMDTKKIILGGQDIHATVLFSDIRNFTAMSEKMTPEEVVNFLNEYFSFVVEPVSQNHGVINKFIGDAVMAIYSPHLGSDRHAEDSIKSAIGMRQKLAEFNAQKKVPQDVRFGIGIHTGILVAGNIGTKDRLEYTVVGDTVNVASRIESETKTFKNDILISEDVFEALDESFKATIKFEKCQPVSVKGKEKPLMLYKLL